VQGSRSAEPEFELSDGFMVRIRRKAGQVAGQVTGQVDPWIIRVLSACQTQPLKSGEIQVVSGIRHRETFQRNYLDHLLEEALLERAIPDKPNSPQQKYRITKKGMEILTQSKS
jgi:predicted transcriptional regulator